jgi:excisionase family DNA binding protein
VSPAEGVRVKRAEVGRQSVQELSITSLVSFVSKQARLTIHRGVQIMTAVPGRPAQLPSDDEIQQAKEASRQLVRLLPEGRQPLRLVTDDNRHEMIAIPPGALRLLVDVLTQLGQGNAVTVLPQKAELTTQEVADYLNVSRPYVVGLIESGKLPARKVGTRRRVSFADLLRFDEEDGRVRRAALQEVTRLGQELDL